MKYSCLYLLCVFVFLACKNESNNSINSSKATSLNKSVINFDDSGLYSLIPKSKSHLKFDNHIVESVEFNSLVNDAFIQGAGVGIIDVNNDGLQDIYFAGNMVGDALYLNEGNFSFKDISNSAGLSASKNWSTGVAVVDINNDGYQDIYVCKFFLSDPNLRKNVLLINNKDNTFTDKAAEYGLADNGFSIMANFFDMDNDGDLDLYLCNQPPGLKTIRKKIKPTDFQYTDRLYRNEGNGKFIDITESSGIKNVCYSLSATVSDFNNDGYQDIYVASDFEEPDLLYQNNGNGTFTNVAHQVLKHMSNFSMGADIADINNDGYMDVFTADMVAEDNFRNKTNMSSMAVEKFWNLVDAGYHYQFMFNSLQLNNGNGTFSEIAQMSGVSKTDWSWSSLFIDADQDGYKDLFVSNGILQEIRNKDYSNELKKNIKEKKEKFGKNIAFDPLELTANVPSVKIKNRAFRNSGDLSFEDKTDRWGFEKPGWTQGMAYADFDNDGDLDLVMNNMNDSADIYQNLCIERSSNNYLIVSAEGMPNNIKANNSKVKIEYGDQLIQVFDQSPYRGYMSSSQNIAHFGLGQINKIDKLTVTFSDGKEWTKENVKVNQMVKAEYASSLPQHQKEAEPHKLFKEKKIEPSIVYNENEFNDYNREVLIPYKMSNLGPVMAKGDINNDGNEDLFVGGAVGFPSRTYLQSDQGTFTLLPQPVFDKYIEFEDGGAIFVDFDQDGDLDLYVSSGGNEYLKDSPGYQDRLYINKGDGIFFRAEGIPAITTSTGQITPLDFDSDGDMDLFVAGRQSPGGYGLKVNSFLIENKNNSLVDRTQELATEFNELGMVTASSWHDIDADGVKELIVIGEWMPITVFKWIEGKFQKTDIPSLASSSGLWNSLEVVDIDKDGDVDLIGGNYGLNYKYKASEEAPLKLYVNDFDQNGTHDVYLGYVDPSDGNLYPVRGRQCSSEQMPFVEEKFKNYNAFGKATVDDVLEGKMEGTTIEECKTLAHTVYLNDGKGNFIASSLPMLSQVAPFYDIEVFDINKDDNLDIIGIGNFYNREIETTRSDAGVGAVLLGDGAGGFMAVSPAKTGITADKDCRAMLFLNNKNNKPILAIANNESPMQFYTQSK